MRAANLVRLMVLSIHQSKNRYTIRLSGPWDTRRNQSNVLELRNGKEVSLSNSIKDATNRSCRILQCVIVFNYSSFVRRTERLLPPVIFVHEWQSSTIDAIHLLKKSNEFVGEPKNND